MINQFEVKVLSTSGQVAVIRHGDKTLLISKSYVQNTKVGQKVMVPAHAISTGTEYGIDWSIIFPEGITISAEEIQSALYSYGIFTIEDIEKNPNGVVIAMSSLMKKISIGLYKTVHTVIGGT
jgi:hypothetical protein